jgi:predicted phosphoribosyltransferase
MVRKLGVPGHEEYAFGAIGEDGALVLDQATVQAVGLDDSTIAEVRTRETRELKRRALAYGIHAPMDFAGRTVIIVDDGLATGATMRAAVDVARHRGASQIVVAVPVAAAAPAREIESRAQVVALETPPGFRAVGMHYREFPQVSDDDVTRALKS